MSRIVTLENRIYETYTAYFKSAYETRHWDPYEGIPWAKARENPDPDVLAVAEAYFGVEMYLPDYSARMLDLVRKSRGRHLFQSQWAFEESRHATAIGLWLTSCGAYTRETLHDYEDVLLQEKWTPPYHDLLPMLCYTVLQEYATRLSYSKLLQLATDRGCDDEAFTATFRNLARDEAAHFGFFSKTLSIYLDLFRDEALEAMGQIITNFEMPARALIPGWAEKEKRISELELFTPRIYLKDVVQPCLEALKIDRSELRSARARTADAKAGAVEHAAE
jgi:acyl-[acyl-carrier-protein] desaturase